MNTTLSIKEIRDQITYNPTLCKTNEELFQHRTLRPILKYLNHHLNTLLITHCINFNNKFKELSTMEQITFIQQQLSKNNSLKNQLLGCVIGLLDIEELSNYQKSMKEYNKRIQAMIEQRILDQYLNFLY